VAARIEEGVEPARGAASDLQRTGTGPARWVADSSR